jgi:hypothetical protein
MALIARVRYMIHVKHLIKLMNLNVNLPMTIKDDNKGAKELFNNWSIGWRTSHIGGILNYLREDQKKKDNRHSDKKFTGNYFLKHGKLLGHRNFNE